MSKTIIVSSQDEKLHIRYYESSRGAQFDILTGEAQTHRMMVSEEELLDLQKMIEEILQHKNKRDW
jgi:hypothetical protein